VSPGSWKWSRDEEPFSGGPFHHHNAMIPCRFRASIVQLMVEVEPLMGLVIIGY